MPTPKPILRGVPAPVTPEDPTEKEPEALRPYRDHGLDLQWNGNGVAIADCPWCGKEKKFYLDCEMGKWQCKVCGSGNEKGGGNAYTFLRLLHDTSANLAKYDPETLAEHRKLMDAETVPAWGIVRSYLDGEWLVPGYGVGGEVNNLYHYVPAGKDRKLTLLPTSTIPHALHGVNLYDPKKEFVWLCEGPWDGMALWEALRSVRYDEDAGEYVHTGNEEASEIANANVLATPGANVFKPQWMPLFAGKDVVLCGDNDHPIERPKGSGKFLRAGYDGMVRVARTMCASSTPPRSINFVCWGPNGLDDTLKSGYDIRDLMTSCGDGVKGRCVAVGKLMNLVEPIPDDWVPGRTKIAAATGGTTLQPIECRDWPTLIKYWRPAMKWNDGLDRALSVMMACVGSTDLDGDQLWTLIMSPPSTGKTTLCEGISAAREWVVPKDNINGVVSSFDDGDGKTNYSLIDQIIGKTLAIKDADPILKHPNRDQILGHFRSLYDKAIRHSARNKMSKNWEDVRSTVLMCGTSSLRELDAAELGARFITCEIMSRIDEDVEDDVCDRQLAKMESMMGAGRPADDGKPAKSGVTQAEFDARRASAGYVDYLRRNARSLVANVGGTSHDEELRRVYKDLGQFVAFARARPSKNQKELAQREFSARLVGQFNKLGFCLGMVMGRKSVGDGDVLARVKRCAVDTASGQTTDIMRVLYQYAEMGCDPKHVAGCIGETDLKTLDLLRFMQRIEAVEMFHSSDLPGYKGRIRWRLTPRVRRLYASVMVGT